MWSWAAHLPWCKRVTFIGASMARRWGVVVMQKIEMQNERERMDF